MDGNGNPIVQWHPRLALDLEFLESSSWLTLQLPPDRFNYTLNFDDHWVMDGSNVSSTEHGARFMPVAYPYKKCPEFRSLVHCTTMAWDAYMSPLIGKVGKLRWSTQTSDI